jgi:hypothetical protein
MKLRQVVLHLQVLPIGSETRELSDHWTKTSETMSQTNLSSFKLIFSGILSQQ